MAATVGAVRETADDDLASVCAVLRAAGFAAQVDTLMRVPAESRHGVILAADVDGRIAGVAAAVAFPGSCSGWIGAVGVRPAARGRGLGLALTSGAIDWLQDRGVTSIGLYATAHGRPLYERLGFTVEDDTQAWRGVSTASGDRARLRPLTEADRGELARLDRGATGEDRSPVLGLLERLDGIGAVGDDGSLAGYALRSPWGSASTVVASDPDSGRALMAAVTRAPHGGTLIVPSANRVAAAAVRDWGLGRLNGAERMRLGPPPAWLPERQFATFNLFWG